MSYDLARAYITRHPHTSSAKAVERVAWSLYSPFYPVALGAMMSAVSGDPAAAMDAMISHYRRHGESDELREFIEWLQQTKPNGALEW